MKKIGLLVLLGIIICVITSFLDRRNIYTVLLPPRHDQGHITPPNCTKVYDDGGGAPAGFDSPECPDWVLSSHQQETTLNCQFSTTQGRRNYQEDRVSCNLDINMPLIIGKKRGAEGVRVGVAAIFDGHISTKRVRWPPSFSWTNFTCILLFWHTRTRQLHPLPSVLCCCGVLLIIYV